MSVIGHLARKKHEKFTTSTYNHLTYRGEECHDAEGAYSSNHCFAAFELKS
jgi:hypothetical protein